MENESPLNFINNLTIGGQPTIQRHLTKGKHYPLFKKSQTIESEEQISYLESAANKSNSQSSDLPEILFITSYPPRECGIATYSRDLIDALNSKFDKSFQLSICPLESESEKQIYDEKIKYTLNPSDPNSFNKLAFLINKNEAIQMVLMQHEFGFFQKKEADFEAFIKALKKPLIIAFHTVLPYPDDELKARVIEISNLAKSIIVMTHSSAEVLKQYYDVDESKITVISHGTHLVPHADKNELKLKYNLKGKFVLSTFGLLSSGKGVETTLNALPEILKKHSNVHFLIIGKTHPSIRKEQGELYREMLEQKVVDLNLQQHVQFINAFLPLPILLEYLQLTDIYLFTSRDPNQAVSGTFSYAISCGCPVISTPIPHAKEVLKNESGIIIDFENPLQLSQAVTKLIENESLRKNITSNGLHQMASTAWENSAIAHALLFEKLGKEKILLNYSIPEINLQHIKKMTTDFGIIQFAILNKPDLNSGYTLDDNSRALIALCQHFEKTISPEDIPLLSTYFQFIKFCLQPEGYFLNYVNKEKEFTDQNNSTNLADSNGRAIWALGFMLSKGKLLPAKMLEEVEQVMDQALINVTKIYSTRAIAFSIKGIYYRNLVNPSEHDKNLIIELSNRLVQMYRHEKNASWNWFESYFTYANSVLPEAMLCAWEVTGDTTYKDIAIESFDFLLSKTFTKTRIKVISNKGWLLKENEMKPAELGAEQPIDVAYSVLTLVKFYNVLNVAEYKFKMQIAFNWFLGANHLNQVIYNPCTGGCYDGLEEKYVNLNQGAESTLSYLMARLAIESTVKSERTTKTHTEYVF